MLNEIYKPLKSGSDIRGIAVEGVAGQPVTLTDPVVTAIGYGFVAWLSDHYSPAKGDHFVISVGHDSRVSADHLAELLIAALLDCGVDVKDCGLATTPSMFMTTVDFDCDAAIEITASHHPWNRNGFKFFTKLGGIEGAEVEQILDLAQQGIRLVSETKGTRTETPYMNQYAETLREMICRQVDSDDYARPLRGFHIVVDAGNGASGFYASHVLEPLGADVTGSQFLEPDGMFPNHVPNPENADAMASISKAVVENDADLGVIFDTDGDRAACVGADGREINRNALIALAACIALEGNEGGTIVTDSVTSSGLKTFIEQDLGGKHHRFKRGYRNVIDEAKRLNLEGMENAPLAIETSGHAAMRDNYFLDDGAYLVTQIIIKAAQLRREGRKVDDLIANLVEPAEAAEYRLKILSEDFRTVGQSVIDALEAWAASNEDYTLADDSYEGVRATKNSVDGWFLLRLSVHDPVLPLNIESNQEGGVAAIKAELKTFLQQFDTLDSSSLD